eukprot:6456242-Amphidinium_carterae.2
MPLKVYPERIFRAIPGPLHNAHKTNVTSIPTVAARLSGHGGAICCCACCHGVTQWPSKGVHLSEARYR